MFSMAKNIKISDIGYAKIVIKYFITKVPINMSTLTSQKICLDKFRILVSIKFDNFYKVCKLR